MSPGIDATPGSCSDERFPAARRESIIEAIDGVVFTDPYRWLEEDTPEALAWEAAQSGAARAELRAWEGFERLRRALPKFMWPRRQHAPVHAGRLWFHVEDGALCVAESLGAPGRAVLPGAPEPQDELPPSFDWFEPSPDGRYVAYGAAGGGGVRGAVQLLRMRILEVATGRDLPLRVPFASIHIAWFPDVSGFYVVVGRDAPTRDPDRRLLSYRIDASAPTEEPLRGLGFSAQPQLSADGRWVTLINGTREPRADWLYDRSADGRWRPFLMHVPAVCFGTFRGANYIALTTWKAPHGRIVSIPVASADDSTSWRELVPESDEIIRGFSIVDDSVVVASFDDAYSRLRVYGTNGAFQAEVPLPRPGSVSTSGDSGWFQSLGEPAVSPGPGGFAFVHQDYISAPALHWYDIATGQLRTLTAPAMTLDNVAVKSERICADDGAAVPVKLVHRRDMDFSLPRPAIVFCYGAYNFATVPGWIGVLGPVLEAGGLVIFAHIRGGGEYGAEWWRAGHHEHKQRSFDDIYAVAEGLIARGFTAADRLGLVGLSNGGLNVCTALVQRPDLFRVGAALAPQCDLVRYSRDPFSGGAPVTGAYEGLHVNAGTWRDPAWGRGGRPDPKLTRRAHFPQSMYPDPFVYSPYHLVRDGTAYPALLVVMGTQDVWCPPWHGRKLTASLQAASASDEPIRLRVWEGAGHNDPMTEVDQVAEWLGFLLRHLGLEPVL